MPEIVEVKIFSDFIYKNVGNTKLLNINILNGRYKTHGPFDHYNKFINMLPLNLLNVKTKGKFMYMSFASNVFIGITLGLSGGYFYKKNNSDKYVHGYNNEIIGSTIENNYIKKALNHLNVEFQFENGSIFFYDQLSYGTIKIFETVGEIENKLKTLGIDIMEPHTTLQMFIDKITKKTNQNKEIGLVLLNQKIISGIGNYLRADALWLSKISPFRLIKKLSNSELELLFNNIRLLTWSTYDYDEGVKLKIIDKKNKLPVNYKNEFLVYDRKTDILGNIIKKELLGERHIYWVENYQN
jgi:formamidopyrimidine-DNA glycosylase